MGNKLLYAKAANDPNMAREILALAEGKGLPWEQVLKESGSGWDKQEVDPKNLLPVNYKKIKEMARKGWQVELASPPS